MRSPATIDELHAAGLLDFSSDVPQLTEKGRDYLRVLDDAESEELTPTGDSAADLVLSTYGVFR